MRKIMVAITLVLASLVLVACGGGNKRSTPAPSASSCPPAAQGHGTMGACAPAPIKSQLAVPHKSLPPKLLRGQPTAGQIIFPDRSNNDPCSPCGPGLRAHGYQGIIVKANQGTGFIDGWAATMVATTRAFGLPVGVYDFDQNYSIAEAQTFVGRAKAMGITPGARNTFPLYFDVEYGNFSSYGLQQQVNYVRGLGYRVGMYTGQWYITPHAGCRFPSGLVSVWLSGYPYAPVPCGAYNYNIHQFTSTPIDLSVFLGGSASFRALVSGGAPVPPKPDKYAVLPAVYVKTLGGKLSERESVKAFDRRDCSRRSRRDAACNHYRRELIALEYRLENAIHHSKGGNKVRNRKLRDEIMHRRSR